MLSSTYVPSTPPRELLRPAEFGIGGITGLDLGLDQGLDGGFVGAELPGFGYCFLRQVSSFACR
jgi:hypothetical protein